MEEFSQKDIFVGDLKLHTETFGDASNPACVLIAGKMATARFWTNTFCQRLANAGFFAIRYDARDIGESSEIDWQKAPYTMADLAKDAISILDGYGIKKAHFVGNSMGGWICQKIGIEYPQRVLSLVIISAGPLEITEEFAIPLSRHEQEILDNTSKFFTTRKDGKTLEETVQSFLPAWRHLNADIPLDEEMANAFTRDFLTRAKNKNRGKNHELVMLDFLAKMERTNNLRKIHCPTLVIQGDKDPVVLPRHGKSVADTIMGAKLEMIEGMGHAFFNRALEEKIARLAVEHMKRATSKVML